MSSRSGGTRTCIALALAAVLAGAASAGAEPAAGRSVADTVRSEILGEDVAVSIYLPASYQSGDAAYPTLYILEDDLYHRALTGIVDTWSRLGKMPETIVVGVATADRWRDFTPTRAGVPGGEPIPTSGGADAHRTFLTDELVPHVERRYRTRPFRILLGHSVAGLQAIATFFARGAPFGACLATSPSLWWDDEMVTAQVREALAEDPARSGRLFLAIGNEDETMQAPLRRFAAILEDRAPGGLRWTLAGYADADHPEVPIVAFRDGLAFVFAGWPLPAAALEAGLPAVDAHYRELSARFGYEIGAPEHVVNRLGYRALQAGDMDGAIAIFRRNVAAHPRSANVHDSLGEAYRARGDLDQARAAYARALELDPGSASARAALRELGAENAPRQDVD